MRIATLMQKHLNSDDIEAMETIAGALADNKTKITCTGLYNHGKSSLLNVLIRDFADKTFKTADIRETVEIQQVELGRKVFIDTPGLNANEKDDGVIMSALKSSDINLFVHRITTGELTSSEVDFLHTVKKNWRDAKEFIGRTIFVLSAIDQICEVDDIRRTEERINDQIDSIFNTDEVKIIPVSAKRFRDGKRSDKKLMIKKGNICQLEKNIADIANHSSDEIKQTRLERLKRLYNDISYKLNQKLAKKTLEREQLWTKERQVNTELKHDLDNLDTALKNLYRELDDV